MNGTRMAFQSRIRRWRLDGAGAGPQTEAAVSPGRMASRSDALRAGLLAGRRGADLFRRALGFQAPPSARAAARIRETAGISVCRPARVSTGTPRWQASSRHAKKASISPAAYSPVLRRARVSVCAVWPPTATRDSRVASDGDSPLDRTFGCSCPTGARVPPGAPRSKAEAAAAANSHLHRTARCSAPAGVLPGTLHSAKTTASATAASRHQAAGYSALALADVPGRASTQAAATGPSTAAADLGSHAATATANASGLRCWRRERMDRTRRRACMDDTSSRSHVDPGCWSSYMDIAERRTRVDNYRWRPALDAT